MKNIIVALVSALFLVILAQDVSAAGSQKIKFSKDSKVSKDDCDKGKVSGNVILTETGDGGEGSQLCIKYQLQYWKPDGSHWFNEHAGQEYRPIKPGKNNKEEFGRDYSALCEGKNVSLKVGIWLVDSDKKGVEVQHLEASKKKTKKRGGMQPSPGSACEPTGISPAPIPFTFTGYGVSASGIGANVNEDMLGYYKQNTGACVARVYIRVQEDHDSLWLYGGYESEYVEVELATIDLKTHSVDLGNGGYVRWKPGSEFSEVEIKVPSATLQWCKNYFESLPHDIALGDEEGHAMYLTIETELPDTQDKGSSPGGGQQHIEPELAAWPNMYTTNMFIRVQ